MLAATSQLKKFSFFCDSLLKQTEEIIDEEENFNPEEQGEFAGNQCQRPDFPA